MDKIPEKDRKQYGKLKDRARKAERFSTIFIAVLFVVMIAMTILAEKVWKYFLYIAIGLFVISLAVMITSILCMNRKIKAIEKKYKIES